LFDRRSFDDSQSSRTEVKTNRLDSRALSENLRGGQLKSIHVPSPVYRELRHLTQLRDTVVSGASAMKQRIRSLLLFEGIDFPPAPRGSQWSFMVRKQLRELRCSNTVRFKLDQLMETLEFNEKQVVKATKEIRRFCQRLRAGSVDDKVSDDDPGHWSRHQPYVACRVARDRQTQPQIDCCFGRCGAVEP
jgi:hypothetical protein